MIKKCSMTKKVVIVTVITLIVINVFTGLLISNLSTNITKSETNKQIINSLKGISANIDGDRLEKLINNGIGNKEYYNELNDYLNKVYKNCDFKYLYTIGQFEDGKFYYLVDSLREDSEDFSNFGDAVEINDNNKKEYESENKTLEIGSLVTDIEYYDEWGYLVTGYVAIYNSSNEPVAILGGDFSTEFLTTDVNFSLDRLSNIIWFTLAISIVLIATILILYLRKALKPIKSIQDAALSIAEGNLDVNLNVKSEDEIGTLAIAFEKMIENIKNQASTAEQIASGNLSIEVKARSENDILANSMKLVVETLRNLFDEANMLTKAAIEGSFDTRGDENKFSGIYKDIVTGVNRTIDTLVGHIDNMPAPVMIIDKDYNIKYMNKAGTDVIGTTQKQLIGTKCYDNFKTSDCKTQKCACTVAMKKKQKVTSETDAHLKGLDLEISYTGMPIHDQEGEVIGAIELITDQTTIKKAAKVAKKQAEYQEKEVDKLLKDIENLAQGNLVYNAEISKTDEDTKELGETFDKIYKTYRSSINAMSSYVHEISNVLTEMANGNMDVGITGGYKGDFIEIKTSMNCIIDSLNGVLSDINNAAEQVAAGSSQVSDSSVSLSQGATEQASSVEQLTASIEEITTQTKQNAQNANEAKELAEAAKSDASEGSTQMQEMLNAMDEINNSSNNISKIIKVIDEIAFQTNLLALNAAVEAARAGQHGKGFAVVAEEVRNLAARSAKAAKETTAMIEGSMKKVKDGTKIANTTAEAFNKIVEGVSKATTLVEYIATASNEQAVGMDQINNGTTQIANVIQTTSATSEETASASEELSNQAEILKNQVGTFTLKKNSRSSSNEDIEELNPEVLKILEKMRKMNKN